MEKKLYYTANEVSEILGISVSHAYKVIREANEELKAKGYFVRAGRVSRKYLDIDDVKTVYHKEFDEALEEYNKKQTRPDRRIEDYFEHVSGKEQDMAVEIIIQIGDREFWKQYDDMKSYIKLSYQIMLDKLMKILPQFVVANAVIHLDEDSPHMHIVGVPVADGYKKGLRK